MDSNIYLYIIAALFLFLYLKKKFDARGISNYSASDAKEKIKSGSIMLDVRTDGERGRNSIKGSLHIPVHELSARMKELEKYKSREIICYCASGSRSVGAASKLKKAGFAVGNLSGGIASWNFSNL